eukprot:6417200-Pyramimonas_sp.AAC.1
MVVGEGGCIVSWRHMLGPTRCPRPDSTNSVSRHAELATCWLQRTCGEENVKLPHRRTISRGGRPVEPIRVPTMA